MTLYVGLDTATVTGVAFWNPRMQVAAVVEFKGSPVEQLHSILGELPYKKADVVFVLEKLYNFRNAKTTRSLLERYGYLKYTLIERGFRVEEVHPRMARNFLKVATKEDVFRYFIPFYRGNLYLSSNHTDALAVALYQADCDGWGLLTASMEIQDA